MSSKVAREDIIGILNTSKSGFNLCHAIVRENRPDFESVCGTIFTLGKRPASTFLPFNNHFFLNYHPEDIKPNEPRELFDRVSCPTCLHDTRKRWEK